VWKAVSFVGFKGSGKTTAIINVAKVLKDRGFKVAIIKHMPEHDIDKEASDTYRYRQIVPNVIAITRNSTVLFTNKISSFLELTSLLPNKVDFLLIEGFKEAITHPRVICAKTIKEVELLRNGLEIAISGLISENRRLRDEIERKYQIRVINAIKEAEILADIISKKAFILPGVNCKRCGYDCYTMAKLIVKGEKRINDCKVLQVEKVKVLIDGKPLILNTFVQKLLMNTIVGMLSSLKGFHEGDIVIYISP